MSSSWRMLLRILATCTIVGVASSSTDATNTTTSTTTTNSNTTHDSSSMNLHAGRDDDDYDDEEIPPLYKYPWWVKIREEYGLNSFNYVPGSRRASSSVIYNANHPRSAADDKSTAGDGSGTKNDDDDDLGEEEGINENDGRVGEYMIISGGYTYRDWRTFPVYAFPITGAERTLGGGWIDLTPQPTGDRGENGAIDDPRCLVSDSSEEARDGLYLESRFVDEDDVDIINDMYDPWTNASHCPPSGRMGHVSGIHDGKLYVFGGLIYDEELEGGGGGSGGSGNHYRRSRRETFRLEDVPYVYRLDLMEMFDLRRAEGGTNTDGMGRVTGWQRIVPRVRGNYPPAVSAAEVLLLYVNRGEMQGGTWSSSASSSSSTTLGGSGSGSGKDGGHDKLVMYGGLQIAREDGNGHHPSKFVKGGETTHGSSYSSSQNMLSHKIVEVPLGDVWAYDYALNCWEMITNGLPGGGVNVPVVGANAEKDGDMTYDIMTQDDNPSFGQDGGRWSDLGVDPSPYPRPRTAHAATVVGSDLVIHGGMGFSEHLNDWDGSSEWETLDDMWILDLNTRRWKRRWVYPLLVRSYHTLVGWNVDETSVRCGGKVIDNCTSMEGPVVAAFGGYTTGMDVISGEELAYVFDDLLVSFPPPSKSYSDVLSRPTETDDLDDEYAPTPWLKASAPDVPCGTLCSEVIDTISIRYQHSAVLSSKGVLTVWGGNFETTNQIDGVWMINIAGKGSNVNLAMAEEDAIFDDYERTITALHTMMIMLMFLSISLTLFLGLTQRYQELLAQAHDDREAGMAMAVQDFSGDVVPTRRGNGLHPEIIDTIPRKIYSENDATDESEQCCPICLVDYEDGDELRVLPCGHCLHTSCLDAWLTRNPSCPSCRYSLRELVDDRSMLQLRTLRSRLSNHTAFVRFLGNENAGGIEMTDAPLTRVDVVDLRHLSSLSLSEVDSATVSREESHLEGDTVDDPDQRRGIRDWRSRRRQMHRDRRLPTFRGRGNYRRSRVPLVDVDESGVD